LVEKNSGDGRVPTRSALPESLTNSCEVGVRDVYSEHGGLPEDRIFLDYLQEQLQIYEASREAAAAANNPAVVTRLAKEFVAPIDVEKALALVPTPNRDEVKGNLQGLNCAVAKQAHLTWTQVREAQKRAGVAGVVQTVAATDAVRDCGLGLNGRDVAYNLNISAYARLEKAARISEAAERRACLGLRTLRDAAPVEAFLVSDEAHREAASQARPLLEEALRNYDSSPEDYDNDDPPGHPKGFARNLYRNLGTAYCWSGKRVIAATYYKKAQKLGYTGPGCPPPSRTNPVEWRTCRTLVNSRPAAWFPRDDSNLH
jgi:hypothetical protein